MESYFIISIESFMIHQTTSLTFVVDSFLYSHLNVSVIYVYWHYKEKCEFDQIFGVPANSKKHFFNKFSWNSFLSIILLYIVWTILLSNNKHQSLCHYFSWKHGNPVGLFLKNCPNIKHQTSHSLCLLFQLCDLGLQDI